MLYMVLKKTVVAPVMSRLVSQKVEGIENLPESGAILASNHLAFCDSILLPLAVPRQVYFLAKSEYFTGKGLKGAISRWFFTAVGQLPLDRSGGAKSQASLDGGAQKLQEGGYLGIYPEGTRSPDGRAYRPKLGVARLVLAQRVPVVPIGQIGNNDLQPSGTNKLNLRKNGKKVEIRTVIGEPLDFSEYWDRPKDYKIQRIVADRIAEAIRELSEQEYVSLYAADVKNLMTEEKISADQAVERLLAKKSAEK